MLPAGHVLQSALHTGREPPQPPSETPGSFRADVAPYVSLGLPPHLAKLLSHEQVPSAEVAAHVLLLLNSKDKDSMGHALAKSQLETKLQERKAQCEAVTERYLRIRGLCSVRGMLEFAEEGVTAPARGAQKMSVRQRKWTVIMTRNPGLEAEICSKTNCKAAAIPKRLDDIYRLLSEHVHIQGVPFGDAIPIVEGVLDRKHMTTLESVANHLSIRYEMHYLKG